MTMYDLVIDINICILASGDDKSLNIRHAAANKVQAFDLTNSDNRLYSKIFPHNQFVYLH